MAKKVCIFTVEGAFQFPIDMLRYDCCYPQQQVDVSSIEDSYDTSEHKIHKVTLASQLIHNPTKDRWASFNWHVTDMTMI